MLEKLLAMLATGQALTMADLAEELDTSTGLIEQMLLDLERAGYLSPVQTQCSGGCSGCAFQSACSLTQGQRIWTVTEAGRRAAQKTKG